MQIIGSGKQRAGKTSRINIAGVNLAYASWEITVTGEDYVTVNFESYNTSATFAGQTVVPDQTFDEGILGPIGADLRFGGDWDAGVPPFASVANFPGLYPRDDLGVLTVDANGRVLTVNPNLFYTSRIDVVGWVFPVLRIRSAVNSAEVKGKVAFNCTGKNQGPFQWPVLAA